MLRSMTGYGRHSDSGGGYDVTVEVKSVNHRFLDLNFRMPQILNGLELKMREEIKNLVSRGSINIYVSLLPAGNRKVRSIDVQAAKLYKESLEEVGVRLGLKSEISFDTLLKFPEIFESADTEPGEELDELVMSCFGKAVGDMTGYRMKEGESIYSDLKNRIEDLRSAVKEAEEMSKNAAKVQFGRLMERLKEYADVETFNRERLEQELVLISDRVDISEEISRLYSHAGLFLSTMDSDAPSGKTLNNLAQEMHREASTVSAKTNMTGISHISVRMKEIIESVREQVQNAE